ncbi:TIM barrel protein [bacterium]|nr:TIM barrel protein [bacterium]
MKRQTADVKNKTTTHRFILLADLHLSDRTDTAAYHALQWAVGQVNRERPDFLAVGGDVTTFGAAGATARFLEAIGRAEVPVLFTPGNAELRRPEALSLLKALMAPERRHALRGDLLVLLPDTASGALTAGERAWLDRVVSEHPAVERRAVITHYPVDKLDRESRAWMGQWLSRHRVELLAAGHIHFHRTRRVDGCLEVAVRGLDPDKASGDLPGLSLFESEGPGAWSERFIPWSPAIRLLPADLPDGISPVGWSIHGDPVKAAGETLEAGLSCLELRPRDLDFSRKALMEALRGLRDRGPLYLSYHLPSLTWAPGEGRVVGEEALRENLACALELRVDHLTVHVPHAPASEMERWGDGEFRPTALYGAFEEAWDRLFRGPASAGVRVAVENIHNPSDTPMDSDRREFGTRIDEYLRWIDAVSRRLGPDAAVGAHLDVGHARNNGGDLDNLQPLGDWYACLGRRILGYHIHQVDMDPETRRLSNHREIPALFSPRISCAGFLWAWGTHQITRGPLFVEVREDGARRRTAALFKRLFERAHRIREAVELTDRPEG